ncbi:MAG: hypothetical protein ACPGVM_02155 [Prochlorococcaceae cyanobacterium]
MANKQVAGPYGRNADRRSVLAHLCWCDGQHRFLNIAAAWLVGHSTGFWRC